VVGAEPFDWDEIANTTMECKGAYAGRRRCTYPSYLVIPGLDDKTPGEKMETTDAICVSCLVLPLPLSHYISEEEGEICGSWWERDNGYNLAGQPSETIECTENCDPGYFVECSASYTCAKCKCEHWCGSNGNDVDGNYHSGKNKEFCFVDHAECTGMQFVNNGTTCTNFSTVECPIGQVYGARAYDHNATAGQEIYTNMADLFDEFCLPCQHPGPGEDSYSPHTDLCTPGEYWPGCTEKGLMEVPQCIACESVDNSIWDQHPGAECFYSCEEDYYKDAEGLCIQCNRYECQTGEFRQKCGFNATEPLPCRTCLISTEIGRVPTHANRCVDEYYKEECTGAGYCALSDLADNCENSCKACNIGGDCNATQKFEICKTGSTTDTGECVMCPYIGGDGVDENTFSEDGTVCTFECQQSYYLEYDTATAAYRCTECSDDTQEICMCGTECEGYTVESCGQRRRAPPGCSCEPGYRFDDTTPVVACHKCENFQVTTGGSQRLCLECPPGYTGDQEEGGTFCIPCPVDSYKNVEDSGGCLPCDSGTDGIKGATTCEDCSTGLRAKLVEWEGYVRNYHVETDTTDEITWNYFKGIPPNLCMTQEQDGIQNCRFDGDVRSIQWKVGELDTATASTLTTIRPTWTCETCANGLAYSTNFDWVKSFQ
jgi:hypothetical protein